ncbi:hypothetical protein N8550_02500, partial [Pirellulaceae bacterium]|nr:hypothetical protein [Pirellulaceae bacterium]
MSVLHNSFHIRLSMFVLFSMLAVQTVAAQSEVNVDYLTEIKPLLRDKCFSCHSSLKQEGGLRLDAASLIQRGGDSGPAYVAGTDENSLILERVTDDEDSRMPPAEDGAP